MPRRVRTFPRWGAGALAGSGFPIDRVALAHELGFREASANSIDAVADRDFVVELLSACSLVMLHLSRLCGEIVLWSSVEFSFASLPDSLASGSSMMPNKKNPCAAELVRAKSGRVAGDLVAMLMVLKGLPLAYNRDLQEDKEALFDGVDTTLACLHVTARLVLGLRFRRGGDAGGGDRRLHARHRAGRLPIAEGRAVPRGASRRRGPGGDGAGRPQGPGGSQSHGSFRPLRRSSPPTFAST